MRSPKLKSASPRNRRKWANMLETYKAQLEIRHRDEPLKSPPLFLLQMVISQLRQS